MLNKTQLKQLAAHLAKIEEIYDEIEAMRSEAQDAFDDKSERWQEGDKGQETADQINQLESLVGAIESAKDEFGNFELNS
jgi:hypothetical protein